MKLASYRFQGESFYGAITDQGAIALSSEFPQWPDLKSVVEAQALDQLAQAAKRRQPTHALADIQYDIPIPNPEKILCVGVNYPARNEEYKDGQAAPKYMSLFPRFPRSFVGHQQPIVRPKASEQFDYEGEIAIVIGKGGRHIPEAHAAEHIAALTLANDGTLRDWVRHAKFNVTQGKNFDASGSIGPWLVPLRDAQQLEDLELATHVNQEQRQHDNTGRMMFPIAQQVAYISTFTTLAPGDIILTGTPTGAGARFDPPRFLVPGDEVRVSCPAIGTLSNTVVDEA